MFVSRATSGAAVLGGLVWVVAALLDLGEDVNPVAYALGLLGFLLALAGLGYGLVEHAPAWLRAVVSVATPLLGYGVWFTVAEAFTASSTSVLVAGVVLAAVGGLMLWRGRNAEPTATVPVRGRRAAR